MSSQMEFKPSTDRTLFEIIRHRLWQINDEQGTTIKTVSGSPIATEIQDFNVGIADADGQLVACGMYLLVHVTGLSDVINNCIREMGKDRIRPGDMYLTNDPWMGAVHHNDVAIVAPLHHEGKLVGWTGSVIHQADVGGPAPGSWNLDAWDTFQEAPRFRLLKIVDEGDVCQEVINTVITNSRTPHLSEIDYRAQIAAANVVRRRMAELFDRYGAETVSAVMQDCLEDTELKLARRLEEMPDGVWHAQSHVDHDGHEDTLHSIRLTLTKVGPKLTFDFSQSDPQANGLINITRSALKSAPFAAILTYLCGGLNWNEGVLRHVEIKSQPGTIVDCTFPAAVASGIVNAGWAALDACGTALGRMMLGTDQHERAMAVWAGGPYGINIFGKRRDGNTFGALLGTSPFAGAGARTFADGYDVSGYLHAPRCGAMNVESTECIQPVLHLFRRRASDSGGPGLQRGGQGIETAITPYDIDGFGMITTSFGADHSGSEGLGGGFPGGGGNGYIYRGENPLAAIAAGRMAPEIEDFATVPVAQPSKARNKMNEGDVLVVALHGGGGFGDPLLRASGAVADDCQTRTVSRLWAVRVYGVIVDEFGQVDEDATLQKRSSMRAKRKLNATPLNPDVPGYDQLSVPSHCPSCRCKTESSPPMAMEDDLGEAGPWLAVRWQGKSERFRLLSVLCGKCHTLLDTVQVRLNTGSNQE